MSQIFEFYFVLNTNNKSKELSFHDECRPLLESNGFSEIQKGQYTKTTDFNTQLSDVYKNFKSIVYSIYSSDPTYIDDPEIELTFSIKNSYEKFSNEVNSDVTKIKYRLYCGYMNSTAESTTLQNEWGNFHWPSTPVLTFRDSGGHIGITGQAQGKFEFVYQGNRPTWLDIEAVCNVYKGSGGNANRNLEMVWHINGVPAGPVRGSYMNNQDCNILTGTGQLYLYPGWVFSPMIRNIENDDKINLRNCTFNIVEDN